MNLQNLSKIAIYAAQEAGAIIRHYLDKQVDVQIKTGGSSHAAQVVTEVDKACEQEILNHLLPTCKEYDLALLSEETEDDGSRLLKDYFWCIDPMDGTLSFIQGCPGFAVSIALVRRDGLPLIGVVYDPSNDTLYHAVKGEGVYKNDSSWQVKAKNDHLTYVTDRRLRDTPQYEQIVRWLEEIATVLGLNGFKELSGSGSVLNAMHVLENGPACMLKLPKSEEGGGSVWDFAATACIFNELNLPARSFMGSPLNLNPDRSCFMNREGIFYAYWK